MEGDRSDWSPWEAHAVYECVQEEGPNPGMAGIIKTKIEYAFSAERRAMRKHG